MAVGGGTPGVGVGSGGGLMKGLTRRRRAKGSWAKVKIRRDEATWMTCEIGGRRRRRDVRRRNCSDRMRIFDHIPSSSRP
jgi:hypothetical protein